MSRLMVPNTGSIQVDPLLWRETRYLLTGPSHARAVRILDEFLASNGEGLVRDSLKRAVFQHDLWAVFDWLASTSEGDTAARTALMRRLARVMRRVALTRKNIEALPDTYAAAVASGAFADRAGASQQQPFLPRDLFSATGPWASVGGTESLVPQHAAELSRSAFIVLWSLPGGSAATIGYLRKLWDFPQPFVSDETFQFARDGSFWRQVWRAAGCQRRRQRLRHILSERDGSIRAGVVAWPGESLSTDRRLCRLPPRRIRACDRDSAKPARDAQTGLPRRLPSRAVGQLVHPIDLGGPEEEPLVRVGRAQGVVASQPR